MKVAIATLGRFHVLDLARELDALGVDTTFYSYVPPDRAERFGLPKARQRSVLPFVAPLVAWERYAPQWRPDLLERAMSVGLNAAVRARLAPCDVFVCMSGAYLEAAAAAKKRYGAQVWLERGSRHILSQREILKALGETRGPTDYIVARELAGYALADRIVVPASQVVESFMEKAPEIAPKLFVNPYGVDLEQFPQRPPPPADGPLTAILVGAWSRRKGVDVLVDAVRRVDGLRLLHVGGLADAPFPHDDPRFEHVDLVPQWRLKEFYARAHVFALASREEGLALVQPQALASGLPLVCTTRTGGADLKLSPGLAQRIEVTEPDDAAAFASALQRTCEALRRPVGLPPLAAADRELLSWAAYGRRYFDELKRTVEPRP